MIPSGWPRPTLEDHPLDRRQRTLAERRESSHGMAVLSDLKGLPGLDSSQVDAQVLAQFTHPDSRWSIPFAHVAQSSTINPGRFDDSKRRRALTVTSAGERMATLEDTQRMTDQPATPTSTTEPRIRSWPRILVAAALAISGGSAILYAGILPMPPFTDQPALLAWQAFGVAEVLAAIGVFLGRAWGRWLAVVVIVITMALNTARTFDEIAKPDPTLPLLGFLVGITLDVLILWWLLRRWPAVVRRP